MNLTRWRNSHGFGVHSPFGFRIAKGVVSPGRNYSYYAEQEITRLANKERLSATEASHFVKIHRLVSMLHIHNAYSTKSMNKCLRLALLKAGVRISNNILFKDSAKVTSASEPFMQNLYIFEESIQENIATEILSTPGNVLMIYNNSPLTTAKALLHNLHSGIIISGNFCTLAFSRIQTQPVCYQMDL